MVWRKRVDLWKKSLNVAKTELTGGDDRGINGSRVTEQLLASSALFVTIH